MASTPTPFGEWLPDQPSIGLKGLTVATNVIPDAQSYLPFPNLVVYSNSIGARCQGGIFATDFADNNYNYVGDASALYVLTTQSFSDATRLVGGAYTTNADDFWEFAQWGNTVIGVNGFTDLPQQISFGAANFANLSTGVKAKHIAIMRDFVVMGNVSDSAANVYRVRWCAINNPTSWTANAATLADFQDLPPEGGRVQKVLGGEYGVILQQRSVWRMLFVGSPLVFQFDRVHNSIGAYIAQSTVRYQNLVFFLSEEGFYAFDGSALDPIGRGKVDKFFLADFNTTYANRLHAAIDPPNKLALWAYPSSDSIGGNPDKLLIYSWAFKRWTLVTGLNIQYLLQNISTGYTLDGLDAVTTDLDALPWSLDSNQWTGGQIALAAFNASNRLARFNGSAMAATLTTGEFQLFTDKRAQLTEIRPYLLGLSASATLSVLNRNNLTESISVGATATFPNATGFVQCRVDARYFHIRMETSPSVNFTHLAGMDVKGTPSGER
jgi:hypothetical protein